MREVYWVMIIALSLFFASVQSFGESSSTFPDPYINPSYSENQTRLPSTPSIEYQPHLELKVTGMELDDFRSNVIRLLQKMDNDDFDVGFQDKDAAFGFNTGFGILFPFAGFDVTSGVFVEHVNSGTYQYSAQKPASAEGYHFDYKFKYTVLGIHQSMRQEIETAIGVFEPFARLSLGLGWAKNVLRYYGNQGNTSFSQLVEARGRATVAELATGSYFELSENFGPFVTLGYRYFRVPEMVANRSVDTFTSPIRRGQALKDDLGNTLTHDLSGFYTSLGLAYRF